MLISQRVRTIEPSATIAVNNQRLRLEATGRKVFNFSVGEPDFPTPEFVRRAAAEAVERGWTRYTASAGVLELRQAIARTTSEARGVPIDPAEVVVTCGAKQACANLLLSLVDPGDEVLLPAPYWVSYPEMIRLAEGIPLVVPTTRANGYKTSTEFLAQLVTPRTTGLIINSPGNPTGCVYSAAELDALVAFAEEHDLWILSDEIYDRFVFDGAFASPFRGAGRARTILISGLSKTYAMTGWRIGWAIGDRKVIDGMIRLQEHTTSNAAAVSQAAALAAVEARPDRFVDGMIAEFAERRRIACRLLAEVPGLEFTPPPGAFYIFLDLRSLLGKGPFAATPRELCADLLERAGIAIVPGEAFGEPGGARLSYACSRADLEAGIAALAKYFRR